MHVQFTPRGSDSQVVTPSFPPSVITVRCGSFSVQRPSSDLRDFLSWAASEYPNLSLSGVEAYIEVHGVCFVLVCP